MESLFVGQYAMDKITKHVVKVIKLSETHVNLEHQKTKEQERLSVSWFLDLFKVI